MACDELLSSCVYALVASFGSVVVALVALSKARTVEKTLEEKKV